MCAGVAIIRSKSDAPVGVTGLPHSVSFLVSQTPEQAEGQLISAEDAPASEEAHARGASTVTLVGDQLIGHTFIAREDASQEAVMPTFSSARAAVNAAPLGVDQTSRCVSRWHVVLY